MREVEVTPERLKESFPVFMVLVWAHLRLPPPTVRQLSMASYLQNSPHKSRCLQAWRGAAKSWITAAYVLWRLYRHDWASGSDLNILVVSAGQDRAEAFTSFVLQLIKEIPLLRFLQPRPGQKETTTAFKCGPAPPSQTPSVMSRGIGGQITGFRADIIIADDVEVGNNSDTVRKREQLAAAILGFEPLLKPEGLSEITYLGTPQSEESIYWTLPDRKYNIRKYPLVYPTPEEIAAEEAWLDPDILAEVRANPALAGTTVEPERFDDEWCLAREASIGRAAFALQYKLSSRLSDAERYPLRLSDLLVWDFPKPSPKDPLMAPERLIPVREPEYLIPADELPVVGFRSDRWYRPRLPEGFKTRPFDGIVMAVDPSGRGSDETGWAVVGACNGFVYLLDAGGFRDGYSEQTLEGIARKAAEWKVNLIKVEANFGDGMFTRLLEPVLRRIYHVGVEEIKNYGSVNKERRICDVLEPVMQQRRLVVNRRLIEADYRSTDGLPSETGPSYQLFRQLSRLTRAKKSLPHDDRVEALAEAVAHWSYVMAVDAESREDEEREAARIKALDEYWETCKGQRAPELWNYI